jgi:hypothetical protein
MFDITLAYYLLELLSRIIKVMICFLQLLFELRNLKENGLTFFLYLSDP